MIKEITKEQAIAILAKGKTVYVFDEVNGRFGNLVDVLNERLVADIDDIEEVQEIKDGHLMCCEDDDLKEAVEEPAAEPAPAEEPAEEPKAEPVKKARVKPAKKDKPKRTKAKDIDWDKVNALRRAGWGVASIADEMGVHVTTVYNRFYRFGDPMKMERGE